MVSLSIPPSWGKDTRYCSASQDPIILSQLPSFAEWQLLGESEFLPIIKDMNCPYCGSPLDGDPEFCPTCHLRLRPHKEEPEVTEVHFEENPEPKESKQEPPHAEPEPTASVKAPYKKNHNGKIGLILAGCGYVYEAIFANAAGLTYLYTFANLCLLGGILGILGIVFSAKGLKEAKANKSAKWSSIFGLILGILVVIDAWAGFYAIARNKMFDQLY